MHKCFITRLSSSIDAELPTFGSVTCYSIGVENISDNNAYLIKITTTGNVHIKFVGVTGYNDVNHTTAYASEIDKSAGSHEIFLSHETGRVIISPKYNITVLDVSNYIGIDWRDINYMVNLTELGLNTTVDAIKGDIRDLTSFSDTSIKLNSYSKNRLFNQYIKGSVESLKVFTFSTTSVSGNKGTLMFNDNFAGDFAQFASLPNNTKLSISDILLYQDAAPNYYGDIASFKDFTNLTYLNLGSSRTYGDFSELGTLINLDYFVFGAHDAVEFKPLLDSLKTNGKRNSTMKGYFGGVSYVDGVSVSGLRTVTYDNNGDWTLS